MPAQDEQQAQRTLQIIELELAAGRRRLRFSPAVELDYLAESDPSRLRDFQRYGAAGLLLYNLFLLTDLLIVPDVFGRAVALQLGVVTPLAVLGLFLVRRRPQMVEPVAAGLLMLILTCSVLLFAWSHAPDSPLLPFVFPLILLWNNVVVPLRFETAAGVALVGTAGFIASIMAHSGYSDGARWFTLQVILVLVAYSLFAAYRLEARARKSFLLIRRDALSQHAPPAKARDVRDPSDFDGLTGLGSRAWFDATLERLWREAPATNGRVGLLLIELDHFKSLNESHGQQAGDRCLLLLADVLREHTRTGDHATRYGGEEFAILLPGAPLHATQNVAERMRAATEALVVVLGDKAEPGAISISVGCASIMPREASTPAELVGAAEAALYTAKRNGRNRIHPPTMAPA